MKADTKRYLLLNQVARHIKNCNQRMDDSRDIIESLNKLYNDIHKCCICPAMNHEKRLRIPEAVNLRSDVFIISQALAEGQVRLSGVNFFKPDGRLGATGKNLERFLNKIKRSLYPYRSIQISKEVLIPRCESGYMPVYNSEIAHCYPGKNNRSDGDRVPSKNEISNCVKQEFLIREIKLIRPKVLLLMGKKSRDTFYTYFMKQQYPPSLNDHINQIIGTRHVPEITISDTIIKVLPIQHASGANPSFKKMAENIEFIQLIKGTLQ